MRAPSSTAVKKYNSIAFAAVFLWSHLSLSAVAPAHLDPFFRAPASSNAGQGQEVVALPILAESEIKADGPQKVDRSALTAAMIQKMLLDETQVQKSRGSKIKDHALEHAKQLLWTTHKNAALQLAPQQLLFTVVIGGVTFMDFANALKEDPKALETALVDGWGALAVGGFWLMMGATGYSGFVTQTYFANSPTGRMLIPTLGLGTGMFLMGHMGAVFSNPSVQLCGKLGSQFIGSRSSKSLSAEERQHEIAERRKQLFKDYGVDPLSNPCEDAWVAVTDFAQQYPNVAGAIITSLMLQTVSHQVLNRLTARYASQVATSGSSAGRLLAQKGRKIQENALKHGIQHSTGTALTQALSAGLAFSRGSGGAIKIAWGFKAVSGVFSQMAVHLAIFIKVHHKIQPHVTAMWHGLMPFSSLGSYLDDDGEKLEKHIARVRKEHWRLSGKEDDVPFKEIDTKCLTQVRRRNENAKVMNLKTGARLESEVARCFEMNAILEKLSGHLYDWRSQKLLVKTNMAHQMWKQSLQSFQNASKSAYVLYKQLIQANQPSAESSVVSPLTTSFATYGVRRPGAGKSNRDFLKDPQQYIEDQKAHIKKVIALFPENFPTLKKDAQFQKLFSELSSSDLRLIGQGLAQVTEAQRSGVLENKALPITHKAAVQWLFEELGEPTPLPEPGRGYLHLITEIDDNRSVFIASQNLYNSWLHREGFWNWLTYYPSKFFSSLYNGTSFGAGLDAAELAQRAGWDRIVQEGKSTPLMDWYTQTWSGQYLPDVGFGVSFVPWLGDMIYNSFKTSSFRRYLAPHVVDKLVQQMACGPEVGFGKTGKVAAWVEGYTPTFIPPAIVSDPAHARSEICEVRSADSKGTMAENLPTGRLYSDSFKAKDGKTYQGILEYIRGNLLKEVRTPEEFDQWWNRYVETENQKIYQQFRVYYDSLVVHTWKAIYAPDSYGKLHVTRIQQSLNNSEVGENTVVGSLEQQLKLSLSLIQDIYLQGLKAQGASVDDIRVQLSGAQPSTPESKTKASESTPVLSGLRSTDLLSLEHLMKTGTPSMANMNFVDTALAEFRETMQMMSEAEVLLISKDGRDRQLFRAKYDFKELKKRTAHLTRLLDSEISARFELAGVQEDPLAKLLRSVHKVNAPKVKVDNPVTARTIELLRQMALQVANELETYGGIFTLADLQGNSSIPRDGKVKVLGMADFKNKTASVETDIPLLGGQDYED